MRRPEIIQQIREAIHKADPSATAILYGSEARGDARPDSDIDLLILLEGDKMCLARELEITEPLYAIEWATGTQISPRVMLKQQWENRPVETPYHRNIVMEGQRL